MVIWPRTGSVRGFRAGNFGKLQEHWKSEYYVSQPLMPLAGTAVGDLLLAGGALIKAPISLNEY